MRKRSSRPSPDPERAAEQDAGPSADSENVGQPDNRDVEARRQAARLLGSLGGKRGGPARARKLSAGRRREIARKAARTRWKPKPQ
jgi:hypothetical protein